MPIQDAPRQMIQGVHVLLLKTGPYIEVAERVRSVHNAGKAFSFERGEVLRIHQRWIYRAYISVNGERYIGDAEIHFGAPPDTPDGTNPITCGQTSAIGNALTFAGFGDLKSILARLGQHLQRAEEETPPDEAHRMIQDIEVVMLNDEPYVTVAERLSFVHLTEKTLSMQECKIICYNNVWIYRAAILVGGEHYIGDAEIYFDAQQEPDKTYPISCAQTSAVGNALAFAGFGDVRSILERTGRPVPETLAVKPLLASADAVMRAHRLGHQEEERFHTLSQNEQLAADQREQTSHEKSHASASITSQQRDLIRVLCERLGESEPAYDTLTYEEADLLITQLRSSEDEFLLAADDARQQELPQSVDQPQTETRVSREAVGMLKEAWLQAFQITGSKTMKRVTWAKFKHDTCHADVDDDAMLSSQHDQLLAAIVAEEELHQAATSTLSAKTPQANGLAH